MTTTATLRLAARRDEDTTAALPLSEACLCLDDACRTVFHLRAQRCPRCGLGAFMLLAAWLDRDAGALRSDATPSGRYPEGALVRGVARRA